MVTKERSGVTVRGTAIENLARPELITTAIGLYRHVENQNEQIQSLHRQLAAYHLDFSKRTLRLNLRQRFGIYLMFMGTVIAAISGVPSIPLWPHTMVLSLSLIAGFWLLIDFPAFLRDQAKVSQQEQKMAESVTTEGDSE